MPTCEYCGTELGNEGAKKQHEDACDSNPANRGDGQTRELARADQGRAPARRGGGDGENVVDSFIRLIDDDLPAHERTKGARGVFGAVMEGIDRYQEYREKKMQSQDERARNVDIEQATEFPACECGYQFGGDDIGLTDDRVRCPECGRLYEIIDPEEPIDA